jgi:diguanylate cyclase (GGDEF)-like protein
MRESDEPGRDFSASTNAVDWPEQLGRRAIEVGVMNYTGWTATGIIAGFVVYRSMTGDPAGAIVNAVIVCMLVVPLVMSRFRRLTRVALVAFGIVISASCLMSAIFVSSNGLLWTYLVLWINFLVLPRYVAAAFNLGITAILALQFQLYETPLEQISWVTVALLISACGLIFTHQLHLQRKLLGKLATLDPLTGAGNRRLMQHDLEKAVAEFDRNRHRSTLVVLDLDHFKAVNDAYGHEAGDRLLERFASAVRAALRTEDGLYRLGGEEFVVLLKNMNEQAARDSLNELHERLSGTVKGPTGPLYFSAGAATIEHGENWSRWLARADGALYEAKHGGRNRLCMA